MPWAEFCRINRRTLDRSLDIRPFADDLRALADSGQTVATVRGSDYIAADLQMDPSETFMSGAIGFSELESVRQFEGDTFSWVKGEVNEVEGATRQTVVPFAIDLRPHRRWVAYAVSQRIRSQVFRNALAATLNNAVNALGLLPSEWDVDPVLSTSTIEEWIDSHSEFVKVIRRIKLTNALKDVDEARRKMRLLAAGESEETFKAPRGGTLDLRDNTEFQGMIEGVETGDVEIVITARAGRSRPRFKSKDHSDRAFIQEYGGDLQRGIEAVVDALREFSERKGDVVHGDREDADDVQVAPGASAASRSGEEGEVDEASVTVAPPRQDGADEREPPIAEQ